MLNLNPETLSQGYILSWDAVIYFTQSNGSYFFDDDIMKQFDSYLNDVPRVGPDGHIYGVVSSVDYFGDRSYQIVRIVFDHNDKNYGHVHRPYEDQGDVTGKRELRFNRRKRAINYLKLVVDGEHDVEQYRWF